MRLYILAKLLFPPCYAYLTNSVCKLCECQDITMKNENDQIRESKTSFGIHANQSKNSDKFLLNIFMFIFQSSAVLVLFDCLDLCQSFKRPWSNFVSTSKIGAKPKKRHLQALLKEF